MRRIYSKLALVLGLLMVLALALTACGDSPTSTSAPAATTAKATTAVATTAAPTTAAPTTVAPTTVAPTTVAPTTAAPTTAKATTAAATTAAVAPTTAKATTAVATAGAKKTAIAKATTPPETPAAKVTLPPAGSTASSDPFLELLGKVVTASNNAKSVKLGLAIQALDSTGTVNELSAGAVLVQPSDFQMQLTASGQDIGLVSLGNNIFLNAAGAWQKVTDPTVLSPFKFIFDVISFVLPSDSDIQKFAGSTMLVYPDEKLDDGTPVGMILIDTSTATDASVKELGNVVYLYDKTTYQVLVFRSSSPTLEMAIILTAYDDPGNKVTSPLG
jgi:hypothetical protein